VAAPFVGPAQAAAIKELELRGLATRVLLEGTLPVRLSRWSAVSGQMQALPPQDVLVAFGSRGFQGQDRVLQSPAGVAAVADGSFERGEPFDVEVDDLFSLPVGASGRLTGRVTMVAPPVAGVVRANWVVGLREQQ
jgi:hypothetical protein